MASSTAKTVTAYLAALPGERRKVISGARALVRRHIPKGYKEAMGYGMITWSVPRSLLTETSNGQPLCYVALAAQKNYCALYLMTASGGHARLKAAFAKAGKTFDMGKSCLRFVTIDDIVPDAVGQIIAATTPAQMVAIYHASRSGRS